MTDNPIVAKLWAQCDILRDDGINYSDYVTELVLLLFLKMDHEREEEDVLLPEDARWNRLLKLDGAELRDTYREMLLRLSRSKEKRIAAIYADAQSRIKEPRHLKALITNLDGIQWFDGGRDGLADEQHVGRSGHVADRYEGGSGRTIGDQAACIDAPATLRALPFHDLPAFRKDAVPG